MLLFQNNKSLKFVLLFTFLCLLFSPARVQAEQLFSLKEKEISLEMNELLGLYVLKYRLPTKAPSLQIEELLTTKARMLSIQGRSSLIFSFPIVANSKPRNFIFQNHRELRGLTLAGVTKDGSESLELSLHFNRLANFQVSSQKTSLGVGEILLYIQAPAPGQKALSWKQVESTAVTAEVADENLNNEATASASSVEEVVESEQIHSEIESADEFLSGAGSILLREDSSDLDESFFLDDPTPGKKVTPAVGTLGEFPTIRYAEKGKVREQGKRKEFFGVTVFKLGLVSGMLIFAILLFWFLSRRGAKERRPARRRLRAKKIEIQQPQPQHSVDTSYEKALLVLGLPETLVEELEIGEVRDRYKHLAKVFHADKLAAKELPPEMQQLAKEEFRRIKEAYTLLLDKLTL